MDRLPHSSVKAMLFVLGSILLVGAGAALAQGLTAPRPDDDVPVTTAFSYQGQLKNASGPVNGSCDLRFELWDAATGGSQLGMTETLSAVPVASGLFTVQLNSDGAFGPDAFTGEARWLAVAVRCPAGSGSYTPLDPRQALTAAPYALYAPAAGAAPWSGLSGVPAGFADNLDNDELGALSCSAGQVPQWNGTAWTCAAVGASYANVLVVARSGGQFTSIQAALDSITGTVANRYLVWVAPGTYSETVRMEPYVDVEGAGEGLTVITAPGSGTLNTGTVVGASNAQLRALTVRNTGGGSYAVAIYNSGTAPRLNELTVVASGGNENFGVYNAAGAAPLIERATVSASGGFNSTAIYSTASTTLVMQGSARASGASNYATAVFSENSSQVAVIQVTATAGGSGVRNIGVYTTNGSFATLQAVTATGSGATYSNCGVCNYFAGASLTSVTATGQGAATYNTGARNNSSSFTARNSTLTALGASENFALTNDAASGNYTAEVVSSQLTGSTNTVRNDFGNFTTRVAATQLSGGPVNVGGGSITCAGVYDENYAFYAGTCP